MKKKRIKLVLFVAIVLFIMNLITANLKLGVYEYKPSPNSLS